jgi:[protein-PII] uridylyltransferase
VPLPPLSESGPLVLSDLAGYYAAESQKIQTAFEESRDGAAVLRNRSTLVDSVVVRLYQEYISQDLAEPSRFCLVALGGYGRLELFPHSDIDLLFLTETDSIQGQFRDAIATISRMLWDIRMRVGNSTHTLAECGRLYRDNLEFNISLLDLRLLAGDAELFSRLKGEVVPHLVARDRQDLVQNLVELTSQRHAKYGNTIFHLEPNLKESPGCLRDYHVCRWLARIDELEKNGKWTPPEELWPERDRAEVVKAFEFLADARCFIHYYYGRDDNQLSYDAQAQAADRGVGLRDDENLPAADWMRIYFRHARTIDQLMSELIEDSAPTRSGLYAAYQDWRSRLSNADFSVVRGRIFARRPTAFAEDPLVMLRLFELMARHGLPLSRETEKQVRAETAKPGAGIRAGQVWHHFSRILVQPYAAEALRTMHRLGLLAQLFPEFASIDSIVMRDFYHRYTVDEHSFMTIENLHRLRREKGKSGRKDAFGAGHTWERKFGEILSELEMPEALYFTMLFHDVGKGMPDFENHVDGSLAALEKIQERIHIPQHAWETIQFLVATHLEMSEASQRRDVFDPETVRRFAEVVGTMERLKMLCLLTYTDICSVNPEALTPWKAELLWQLYAATANHLTRSVDDERLRITAESEEELEKVLAVLGPQVSAGDLHLFLEGFPRRYTVTHSPDQIAAHFEMGRKLAKLPIAAEIDQRHAHFDLTVVAADRPYLFASITGTLAAWGMNIVKADAFSNAAGLVLDTITFGDLHRTLELNPSENDRLKQNLIDVLTGKLQLKTLLGGRDRAETAAPPKIEVQTRVRFDVDSSSHSTLLELVAQDRPGLLYDVSSVLADQGCNIEVALIDTEGLRAIDVFYLTSRGGKLDGETRQAVENALISRLQRPA